MDAAVLDRPADLDVVKGLEARAAALVGVLNAAVAGLVSVISDALICGAWQGYGINSPEHWVTLRFGMSRRRAARLVAAARALQSLPACREAFVAGEIGEDHVAAIVHARVQPRNDVEATELARHATVGQLRHGLRGLPRDPEPDPPTKGDDGDDGDSGGTKPTKGATPPREYVSRSWRDDGRGWNLHANLSPIDGALVDKALEAATDKLFRLRYGPGADPALRQRITAVDALRHLSAVALDAMDPATASHPDRMPSARYLVNVHLDAANPDSCRLHLGPLVPAAVRDQLLCDAFVRTWLRTSDGNVNLGRTRRTADPRLRLVVEARDNGCIIPGCEATRGLKIHHLQGWPAGGPTDTSNLVALCSEHHRRLHRGEIRIRGNPDVECTITDATGRPFTPTPPTRLPADRSSIDAAHELGLPPPTWVNRTGEAAQWACMYWTEPPDRSP